MADIWVKVLEPAKNYDLLTLEELKTILGISASDTSEDEQLQLEFVILYLGLYITEAFSTISSNQFRREFPHGRSVLSSQLFGISTAHS